MLVYIVNSLITNEEKRCLAEAFKQIDKNGDGKISKEELTESYKVFFLIIY